METTVPYLTGNGAPQDANAPTRAIVLALLEPQDFTAVHRFLDEAVAETYEKLKSPPWGIVEPISR